MNNELRTVEARALLGEIKPLARACLVAINEDRFSDGHDLIRDLRALADSAKSNAVAGSDDYRNDLWVIERYIDFLEKYGHLWKSILDQRFSESWCLLQDSLDFLRSIKRFSHIDVHFFEDQLIELERTYPYNVFFSIGATVEFFECSICSQDIDSKECPHVRGNLYGGVMAYAIAKNIVQLDHISMVAYPEDKRCVVSYEDSGEQFTLIRYLSSLVSSRKCRISDFGRLQFSKRLRPNPDYRKLPRNERCFCGSGKKFKHCCIGKERIEGDHIDIVAEPKCIEHAVA
ncbi:MAG: hypothetical protein C0607_17060 [Azoarcus sp.]|jgi:hypothetical protein|nr:MAG: hypothetical protein C0607_17060 [Azoarcus sp.]